jgi:hypothetical protein
MLYGRGRLALFVSVAALVCTTGCGPRIDLRESLEVVDVFSGWYHNGQKDGQTHMIPSISFHLRNRGPHPLTQMRLIVGFWWAGEGTYEFDSAEIPVIGDEPLAPGATSDPVLVRLTTGYTLPQPPPELFMHSQFRDAVAKLFAKRSGTIVPLGEYPIDRQILPNTAGPAAAPEAR